VLEAHLRWQTDYLEQAQRAQAVQLLQPGDQRLVAEVGPIQAVTGGGQVVRVPINLRIPMGDFHAEADGDLFNVRLEIEVRAFDRRGLASDSALQTVRLRTKASPAAGDVTLHTVDAVLPEAARNVLVSVHDPLSDTVLVAGSTSPRTCNARVASGCDR
jgi:hypothetical protein